MENEDLAFLIFIIIAMTILGAALGYEFFKLTHNVLCLEQLNGCVPALWN